MKSIKLFHLFTCLQKQSNIASVLSCLSLKSRAHLSSCQVERSVKTSLFIAKAVKLGDLGLDNISEECELLWLPVSFAAVIAGYVLSELEK